MHCQIFTIFILISISPPAAFGNSGFITGPQNMGVVVGQPMTMECQVPNGSIIFKWSVTRPNSGVKEQLARIGRTNFTVDPKLKHFGSSVDRYGSSYIYTNSTQLTEAGLYFCHVHSAHGEEQNSAHLIVVAEPVCTTNSTRVGVELPISSGESISLKCSTNFSGYWPPTVEWTQTWVQNDNHNDMLVEIKESTTEILHNTTIASTLVIYGDVEKAFVITFKLFFQWNNETVHVTATNNPNFTYSWNASFGIKTSQATAWHEEAYGVYVTLGLLAGLLVIFIVLLIKYLKGKSDDFTLRCCLPIPCNEVQEKPDVIHCSHRGEIRKKAAACEEAREEAAPSGEPIYGKVRKCRNATRNETDGEQSTSVDGVSCMTGNNRNVINGAVDNSQYIELGAVTGNATSNPFPSHNPMCSKSTYVEIDHRTFK